MCCSCWRLTATSCLLCPERPPLLLDIMGATRLSHFSSDHKHASPLRRRRIAVRAASASISLQHKLPYQYTTGKPACWQDYRGGRQQAPRRHRAWRIAVSSVFGDRTGAIALTFCSQRLWLSLASLSLISTLLFCKRSMARAPSRWLHLWRWRPQALSVARVALNAMTHISATRSAHNEEHNCPSNLPNNNDGVFRQAYRLASQEGWTLAYQHGA